MKQIISPFMLTCYLALTSAAIPALAIGNDTGGAVSSDNTNTVSEILVGGRKYQVEEYTTNQTTKKIESFLLAKPTVIRLANGNQFTATNWILVDENENIEMISSSEPKSILNWKTKEGQVVALDCSLKSDPVQGDTNRIISLYTDGAYKSGCDVINISNLKTINGDEISGSGPLEVSADFKVTYLQNVLQGQLLLAGQKVALAAHSEIHFFDNGQVHFFSFPQGTTIKIKNKIYGDILTANRPERVISVSFYQDGSAERIIIGQQLMSTKLNLLIPAFSGLIFDQESQEIAQVILADKMDYAIKDYKVKIQALSVDQIHNIMTLKIAEAFVFYSPDKTQHGTVPTGSEVDISMDSKEVMAIRIPALSSAK